MRARCWASHRVEQWMIHYMNIKLNSCLRLSGGRQRHFSLKMPSPQDAANLGGRCLKPIPFEKPLDLRLRVQHRHPVLAAHHGQVHHLRHVQAFGRSQVCGGAAL